MTLAEEKTLLRRRLGDPAPGAQLNKLKRRFHPGYVVLVDDRGMVTSRVSEDSKPTGVQAEVTKKQGPATATAAEGGSP
jgi:hypothetical protein